MEHPPADLCPIPPLIYVARWSGKARTPALTPERLRSEVLLVRFTRLSLPPSSGSKPTSRSRQWWLCPQRAAHSQCAVSPPARPGRFGSVHLPVDCSAHPLGCSKFLAPPRPALWLCSLLRLRRHGPRCRATAKLAKATPAPRPRNAVRCRYICQDRPGLGDAVALAGLASDSRAPGHSDLRIVHPGSERLRAQHPSRFPHWLLDLDRSVMAGGSMICHALQAAAFPVLPLAVAVIEPCFLALPVELVGAPQLLLPRYIPARCPRSRRCLR